MRKQTAVLKDYISTAFPVMVVWNCGRSSSVFPDVESAKNYIIGRLGNVKILDHRKNAGGK